ncbi:hypothetical protein LSCM1_04680 [Leishmania martiniquensis]|uniref:Uncharacterized protein n=1 Tax=Leishmania martiniquensis TaxID=1580590 RepID=A0A836KKW9_9TRYP|nr:hypothetical protein LSCM1_04680 [Leishmania martiniquensis]
MGSNNSRGSGTSLPRPAVGDGYRRQRSRDSQAREKRSLKCLPSTGHASAAASAAGAGAPPSPLAVSALPTLRQHRDTAAGAVTVSSVTQGSRLVSPVSPTRQHGRHSLSSLSTPSVKPSPARAAVGASTELHLAFDETGHLASDLGERERAYGAELSQQQQSSGLNLTASSAAHAYEGRDHGDKADSGGSQSGSVVGARRTRTSSVLQASTDAAVPLPLRIPLSLEGAYAAADDAGTTPSRTGDHARGTVYATCGGDNMAVDVGKYNTSSSQVGHAVLRSTLIPSDGVRRGPLSLSCSPSTGTSPLPLPLGRAARSTNAPRSPSTARGITTTSQWPDERLGKDVKGAADRSSSKGKANRKSKAEGTEVGGRRRGSSSSRGFWRGHSRSVFRKLLSRPISRAASLPSPSRPEAGEERGGSVRGSQVKSAAENDSGSREDIETAAAKERASPAPPVDDLPPSTPPPTASAALGTEQRPSAESLSFHVGPSAAEAATQLTAPTPPMPSVTAKRAPTYQPPHAEGRPGGGTAAARAEGEARSPSSGSTSPHTADEALKPRLSGEECTKGLHLHRRGAEGALGSLDLHPEAQTTLQDSEESDLTTSTDTNSAPILPPPPTASFAEAAWGALRNTAPASPAADMNSRRLLTDYDRHRDNGDDCDTAATASPPTQSYSQQPQRPKVPGVLSTTTVTDTTARVSPRSPSSSPLTVAAAAAFPFSAAAGARVKGRRSVSQSAIIAAWNRMGARSGAAASSVSPGGGHHCACGSPEALAEPLQIASAPGKPLAVLGGSELAGSATSSSRDSDIARAPTALGAEAATGKSHSPGHQLTVAGNGEGGIRGRSHSSGANMAAVLPVRRRSVVTRQRGPPPIFSPSPDSSKLGDALSTHSPDAVAVGRATASPPPQELQRPPASPAEEEAEEEAEERFLVRLPPHRRELPAHLHTPTAPSPAILAQRSSPPESREGDAGILTGRPPQEHILVSADLEDSGREDFVAEQPQLPVRGAPACDDEVASATATTVDADEDYRGNEGDAAERRATQRSLQPLTRQQHWRHSIDVPPRQAPTLGLTTHTAVPATSAAADLQPANSYDRQNYSRSRLMASSTAFSQNTGTASPSGAAVWIQSSLSSPRSLSASDSRMETATGAENAQEEEDSIDGASLRRARDGGTAHGPLPRSADGRGKLLAGLDAIPLDQRFPSPPVHGSQSNSSSFSAMAAANLSGGYAHRVALVRSNSYQSPRPHSRGLARSTSSLSSTARLMPRWRERSTPPPQPTSPLSSSTARDEVGGAAGGLPSTPRGRRGLASQGAPPIAHQPGAHPHQPLQPLMSAASSHMPQHLRRETPESLGCTRWQEVSLRTSGGRSSPNLVFADSSRDGDDTPPCYGVLGDEERDLGAAANEDDAEGAQRHRGCPPSGAVGGDAEDDGDETFLCWESSGAPTWGVATWRMLQRGDDDDESGYEEEEEKVDVSENDAGSRTNGDGRSADGRLPQLPQRRHRPRAASLPTASAQQAAKQQKLQASGCDGGALRGLGSSAPSAEGIPHSSIRTGTCIDTTGRLPQTRYEPPMLSNRNTFTAFVPLSDISSSELLATAAAAFQCGLSAHLHCASPGAHSSEAAAAALGDGCDSSSQVGPCVDTPVTADTVILSVYAMQDACPAEGADVRVDIVSVAGGELPISPLYSSVSTAPTNHISRSNTPEPLAAHGAVARRALESEEAEATRTRCELPGVLSVRTPPKSRSNTKAVPGLSHDAAAAAAVEACNSGGGNDGSGEDSADLPAPEAHPTATSRRASGSLESVRVAAASVLEGKRHAMSDEERLDLVAFAHSPASVHSAVEAVLAVASRTAADGLSPPSAQLSASQSLSGQYSPPQPWWNRRRCIIQSEGSGMLDVSQRGGETGSSGGGHSPFSPHSTSSAVAVVPGGRVASPSSPAGSVAIAESPPGQTLLLGGGAAVPLEIRRSSARLWYETQCPQTLTSDRHAGALRSSNSSGSSEGGNAACRSVAGAAPCGKPNGGTLMKEGRPCRVEDADKEGVAGIQVSAAIAAKHTGRDRDGEGARAGGACALTRTWRPWMPLAPPSSRIAAAVAAAEMTCVEAERDGGLTATALTHVTATAAVVPATASFVEEEEGQLVGDASSHALAVVAASGEPCHDGEGATPGEEVLGGRCDDVRQSRVAVPVSLSRLVPTHRSGADSTHSVAPTSIASPAALDSLKETEAYARCCIEESFADVQEAWVAVWHALRLQHEELLVHQQSVPNASPSGLPSAMLSVDPAKDSTSVAIRSAAAKAESGARRAVTVCASASLDQLTTTKSATAMACQEKMVLPLPVLLGDCTATTAAAGGSGPHLGSGSDAACAAGTNGGEAKAPTFSATMTSREPCGDIRGSSDADAGEGGSGSGPGTALTDEGIAGVMGTDSSASGAEVVSAACCGKNTCINAPVASSAAYSVGEAATSTLGLLGPLNACAAPTNDTAPVTALSPVAPYLSDVVAGANGVDGVRGADRGNHHSRRTAADADADVKGQHDAPHLTLTADSTGAHSVGPAVTTSHCIVDRSSAGVAVRSEPLDAGLRGETPLTIQQSSPEPTWPITPCAAGTPISPSRASVRSLLELKGESAFDARAEGRDQMRPNNLYGLTVSPLLEDNHSTPSARAHSRSQRQHRGPSVGQVVCCWCGEPYTSADVCLVARRLHSMLREERRAEKAAKRAAQMLLCEGRVTEAVTLLKSAGVYVL